MPLQLRNMWFISKLLHVGVMSYVSYCWQIPNLTNVKHSQFTFPKVPEIHFIFPAAPLQLSDNHKIFQLTSNIFLCLLKVFVNYKDQTKRPQYLPKHIEH